VSQRASRLQRKAARVVKSEVEREFEHALGEAKRRRDKKLREIAATHEKKLAELVKERDDAKRDAHREYDEERDLIVKAAARKEAQAA
jgi:hypothetical protein